MSGNIELHTSHLVDEERRDLMRPERRKEEEEKKQGLVQRLATRLDERVNVKNLARSWGPKFAFVARCMLVATFFDDSIHTILTFSAHARQIAEQGALRFISSSSYDDSSGLAGLLAAVVLAVGVVVGLASPSCLLAESQTDVATWTLAAWTALQPVLYAQTTNAEFVAESLSLVGGLLLLRAHLLSSEPTRLVGRLLLPAAYVHRAYAYGSRAVELDVTTGVVDYLASLSVFLLHAAGLVLAAVACALVAAGLRSRAVALALAVLNLGSVALRHPFLTYLSLKGGRWVYDEERLFASLPHVALPTDMRRMDLEPQQIYDLHRYYFFLGLSISGALLTLVTFGPGRTALQSNELVLPIINRAQD